MTLLTEWYRNEQLRPPPPKPPGDFLSTLQPGDELEMFYEDGWWEVLLVGAAERTAELPKYIVEARRYKVRHIVPASSLRPAWKWVAAALRCASPKSTPPPDVPKKKK